MISVRFDWKTFSPEASNERESKRQLKLGDDEKNVASEPIPTAAGTFALVLESRSIGAGGVCESAKFDDRRRQFKLARSNILICARLFARRWLSRPSVPLVGVQADLQRPVQRPMGLCEGAGERVARRAAFEGRPRTNEPSPRRHPSAVAKLPPPPASSRSCVTLHTLTRSQAPLSIRLMTRWTQTRTCSATLPTVQLVYGPTRRSSVRLIGAVGEL